MKITNKIMLTIWLLLPNGVMAVDGNAVIKGFFLESEEIRIARGTDDSDKTRCYSISIPNDKSIFKSMLDLTERYDFKTYVDFDDNEEALSRGWMVVGFYKNKTRIGFMSMHSYRYASLAGIKSTIIPITRIGLHNTHGYHYAMDIIIDKEFKSIHLISEFDAYGDNLSVTKEFIPREVSK